MHCTHGVMAYKTNQTSRMQQHQGGESRHKELQEQSSELQRLTSMQKNREEVQEDERLNKAFPLSKHGSQKKYGSKARIASTTSLDLDPALAGQQSCPLPFALPGSNSFSKERTLNPLTHKSAASNLQLHSFVGSMQNLESVVLDKPSYFFASPQV